MIPLHDENPTIHKPWVTVLIIAACVAIYFFVQPTPFTSSAADGRFEYRHAAVPAEIVQGKPLATCQVAQGIARAKVAASACDQPGGIVPYAPSKHTRLAILSSIFLHASVIHLLGNMLYLWIFGNNIEDRMRPIGYVGFYLIGGVVATMAHVLAGTTSQTPLVGASGAVAAVMGAYFVWYPRAKVSTLIFVFVLRIRAFFLLLAWLVLQFFTGADSNVAWIAHVAGFAFGALVALLLGRTSDQRSANNMSAI